MRAQCRSTAVGSFPPRPEAPRRRLTPSQSCRGWSAKFSSTPAGSLGFEPCPCSAHIPSILPFTHLLTPPLQKPLTRQGKSRGSWPNLAGSNRPDPSFSRVFGRLRPLDGYVSNQIGFHRSITTILQGRGVPAGHLAQVQRAGARSARRERGPPSPKYLLAHRN